MAAALHTVRGWAVSSCTGSVLRSRISAWADLPREHRPNGGGRCGEGGRGVAGRITPIVLRMGRGVTLLHPELLWACTHQRDHRAAAVAVARGPCTFHRCGKGTGYGLAGRSAFICAYSGGLRVLGACGGCGRQGARHPGRLSLTATGPRARQVVRTRPCEAARGLLWPQGGSLDSGLRDRPRPPNQVRSAWRWQIPIY